MDITVVPQPLPLDQADPKAGYISDYISGQSIKATPEEVDAVQVFARRLHEDYGYPKEHIQTRPQFRVRASPSADSKESKKSYPVDIAVFKGATKTEDDLFLLVECKKKNSKEGLAQLKIYMDLCPAEIGVWFNGGDHIYLLKTFVDGKRVYRELPNIPRFDQKVEDIGRYKRKDLKKSSNLKAVFHDLRNHLAGNVTGITRDEALAQEIINLLLCKIYDEQNTAPDEMVAFRCGENEDPLTVQNRIDDLLQRAKDEYSDVFDADDNIKIDAQSLVYVVGELQPYCITEAERDAVGDAFEVFIGPALRGSEGQFFTPRNVVRMMVEILDPKPSETILDPACGSGGFLVVALEYVWRQMEKEAAEKGIGALQLDRNKRNVATKTFRGIDKDSFLAKVTKAYMALIGDGRGGVFCENSLHPFKEWGHQVQDKIKPASFDVIFSNPPFGTKIPIKGNAVLSQFDLGHRWKRDKESGEWQKTNVLWDDQPPQLLFIERCLQLLKPGGRLGIVLPESIFGMPTYEYVVSFLQSRAKITGVISMPEALFKTSGKGGTHAKVCCVFLENTPPQASENYEIFMADAKWCGHDSRGNPTLRKDADGQEVLLDDVPLIAQKYKELKQQNS